MKHLARLLSLLVFVLTVFCGGVLVWYVLHLPEAKIRYAQAENTAPAVAQVPRDAHLWDLSRLSLLPWMGRKKEVVAVMIENHQEARPNHRGLEDALLIEEFFVEGMITRFAALFDAKDYPESVGPVRSLRPYFIDGVLPWASVVFHIGGSPEALERVEKFDDIASFNGIYRDTFFTRVDGIPAPHDAFLLHDSFEELMEEAGDMQSVRWPPYKTGRARSGSGALSIVINFFSPQHNVEYVYDEWHRQYIRTNGKEVSIATPQNVLILETDVTEVGPLGRLAIRMQGEGKVLLFRAGRVYEGRWSKESAKAPLVFTDTDGDPLVFSSGQTWLTVVDSLQRARWEG